MVFSRMSSKETPKGLYFFEKNISACKDEHPGGAFSGDASLWLFQYQVSGHLHAQMQDGTGFEVGPGEVIYLASGDDAWVVGDEPAVGVDWNGALNFAKA